MKKLPGPRASVPRVTPTPVRIRDGSEPANPQDAPTPASCERSDAKNARGDAPRRRAGRQCGYEHRDELLAANRALGKALTVLARDSDPESRRLGAELAADVAAYVMAAAAKADAGSSRSKRIAADLERRLPRLAEQLAQARTRLHPDLRTAPGSVTTP